MVNLKIYRSSGVIRIMLQKPEACGEKIGCQFCQSFLSHHKMWQKCPPFHLKIIDWVASLLELVLCAKGLRGRSRRFLILVAFGTMVALRRYLSSGFKISINESKGYYTRFDKHLLSTAIENSWWKKTWRFSWCEHLSIGRGYQPGWNLWDVNLTTSS